MSSGVCPKCGGENLDYGSLEMECEACYYPRTCEDCGISGEEWYSIRYDGQYNLLDKDGNELLLAQREILRQLASKYSDDVYDFFQLAQGGREGFLHNLELEFIDKQNEELTKYMNAGLGGIATREDLEERFIFWVEKNRGRQLDMGEMNDIYEAIEQWAKDNGFGYLYED